MTFPVNIDLIPSIDAQRTLGQEQHTNLHLETFKRIEVLQSYIGGSPSGGEPDIPEATSTIRERMVALEAQVKNPSPVLTVATQQLPATGTPTADWDPDTGVLTLGIPAGAPGAKGEDGASGTHIITGMMAEAEYLPSAGPVRVPVTFPPQSFSTYPKVMVTAVQKGALSRPVLVCAREVSNVGFVIVVENTGTTIENVELHWMAMP